MVHAVIARQGAARLQRGCAPTTGLICASDNTTNNDRGRPCGGLICRTHGARPHAQLLLMLLELLLLELLLLLLLVGKGGMSPRGLPFGAMILRLQVERRVRHGVLRLILRARLLVP